jgi:hypothetical protein
MELQLIRSATIKIKYWQNYLTYAFPKKHLRPFCRNSKKPNS